MRLFKNVCVALTFIFLAAFVYSWVIVSRQSHWLAGYEDRQSQNLKSIHQLQEALRQEQLKEVRNQAAGQNSENALRSSLARSEAALKASQRQLSAAKANSLYLRARLENSSRRYKKALVHANEQPRKQEEEAQTQLDGLRQQLKTAQVEIQASRLRVNALEAVNAKLRKGKPPRSAPPAEFMPMLHQVQTLDRRREAYVTSVMSRYQDVVRQLSAMRGMLDANRDSNANVFSNEALYRIRDTLSLANNDLRQLNGLNAQIRLLEKKLGETPP